MHVNLYVSKNDQPLWTRLKERLWQERKSVSLFLMEAAERYLAEPVMREAQQTEFVAPSALKDALVDAARRVPRRDTLQQQ